MYTVFVKESGHMVVVRPEEVDMAVGRFTQLFPWATIKTRRTEIGEGIDFGCLARVFGDIDDVQTIDRYQLYLN